MSSITIGIDMRDDQEILKNSCEHGGSMMLFVFPCLCITNSKTSLTKITPHNLCTSQMKHKGIIVTEIEKSDY